MIIYRTKLYAREGDEQEGMSTGKKVALATGATALTAGLAYAGAKRGMFGGRAQMMTNRFHANLGNTLGIRSMRESGATGFAEGMARRQAHLDGTSFGNLTADQQKAAVAANLKQIGGAGTAKSLKGMNDFEVSSMKAKTPTQTPVTNTAAPSDAEKANTNTVQEQTKNQQKASEAIQDGTANTESPAITKTKEEAKPDPSQITANEASKGTTLKMTQKYDARNADGSFKDQDAVEKHLANQNAQINAQYGEGMDEKLRAENGGWFSLTEEEEDAIGEYCRMFSETDEFYELRRYCQMMYR